MGANNWSDRHRHDDTWFVREDHLPATRSPWDTLMALLPPRDYSLRLIAAHHIVEAAVLHYDGSAPIVALSATGRTPEAALEALLTRWRGEQAA